MLKLPICLKTHAGTDDATSVGVMVKNVWMMRTVLEEILQRGANLGVPYGSRRPLQRIILEPRRDSTYNATSNEKWE